MRVDIQQHQVNEDGEVVAKRKDGKDGPWNKLGDAPSNQVNHIVYISIRVQYNHHHHHAEFNGGTRGDSGAKAGSCGAARLQQRGRGQLCSTSHEGPGGSNEDRVDQMMTQWNHSREIAAKFNIHEDSIVWFPNLCSFFLIFIFPFGRKFSKTFIKS